MCLAIFNIFVGEISRVSVFFSFYGMRRNALIFVVLRGSLFPENTDAFTLLRIAPFKYSTLWTYVDWDDEKKSTFVRLSVFTISPSSPALVDNGKRFLHAKFDVSDECLELGLHGCVYILEAVAVGHYAHLAKQLVSCNFGVFAMDWIGHGGSDGLHGYVPSLDHVVADTAAILEKVKLENPGVPCFLFGHSTGGAVVLKAASYPHIEEMLEGVILTSPALRVKPAHPIVGAVAPIFSMVVPRFQFKGANKRGIPVSRDPAALLAKYSDPLVYTGPIRVRTGHEILRISSYLMRNIQCITVPFFVLHGTADRVTDPLASQDLYNVAPSKYKDIKLYEGFLHDLLFEPEREEIARDIIGWMEKRLTARYHETGAGYW